MIRIDADNYVILYLQYEDHLHRYAVPSHFSVANMANHMIDSFDQNKHPKLRRRFDTRYKVYDEQGVEVALKTPVGEFQDMHAFLIRKEEAV